MRNFFVFFLLSSLLVIVLSNEANVTCNYYYYGPVYSCNASFDDKDKPSKENNMKIKVIEGRHEFNKTHLLVLGFTSSFSSIDNFPANLHEIFPNLETIKLQEANISKIDAADLKPLGAKLKELNLTQNVIEVINADLFKFNPNLEIIDFSYNKIKFVAEDVFSNLNNLRILRLNGNPCFSTDVDLPLHELIEEIDYKCQPTDPLVSYFLLG